MKIRFSGIAVMAAAILILYFSLIQDDVAPVSTKTAEVADIPGTNKQKIVSEISKGQSEISALYSEDVLNQINHGECYTFDIQNEKILSQERATYLQELKHSSAKEDQLAYAVFAISNTFSETDPNLDEKIQQQRRETLLNLNQNDNPLVALEKLRMCSTYHDNERCDNTLIDQLTTLHKNDSEIWLEALYYYLATKQDEQIVRAINGAIQGNYSSSFYSLFVSEYTQAMERANIGAYNSAVVGAVGYYAAKAKPYNLQTEWCKSNLQNAVYAQSCLEMGVMMEQKSNEIIDKVLGLAIQRIVYQAEGNGDMAALVQNKAYQYYPSNQAVSKHVEVLDIIFNYEDLLRNYIQNRGALGEFEAFIKMKPEVLAFQESVHYEDCESFW